MTIQERLYNARPIFVMTLFTAIWCATPLAVVIPELILPAGKLNDYGVLFLGGLLFGLHVFRSNLQRASWRDAIMFSMLYGLLVSVACGLQVGGSLKLSSYGIPSVVLLNGWSIAAAAAALQKVWDQRQS